LELNFDEKFIFNMLLISCCFKCFNSQNRTAEDLNVSKYIKIDYDLNLNFRFNDIFLLSIESWQDKYKNKKFLAEYFYDSSYL
jgi:hypothetical protein